MEPVSTGSSPSQRQRVLYVSSLLEEQCGVYQFGKNIGALLGTSKRYEFTFAECAGAADLRRAVAEIKPALIIYNYHPSTLGWVRPALTRSFHVPQLGTIHECSQENVDQADDIVFDAHIAPDPTLLLRNPLMFKTGRFVPKYTNTRPLPETPTIGSFGFGIEGKGFERVIETVQREFDHAHIRLHIPFSSHADADGTRAAEIRRQCERLITKPGVKLSLSHQFLAQSEVLDFLAGNTLNAFFYDLYPGRGISSATDYALAVGRPIALTRSHMFRHFAAVEPSVYIEDGSLREINGRGFAPLEPLTREWSEANLLWDYERIASRMLSDDMMRVFHRRHSFRGEARSLLRRVRNRLAKKTPPAPTAVWVRSDTDGLVAPVSAQAETYRAGVARGSDPLNRILDNAARAQYKPAVDELFRLAPEMLARKIPEANIQQAFVLDTVQAMAAAAAATTSGAPKLLCVGCYEDSAAASLKRLGHAVEGIDPVLNYNLGEFCSRPTTIKGSYDIVFSTSVIEHVPEDGQFMVDIASLLKPGGMGVLTCDYQDQYRVGDPKPWVDCRLYTQNDFTRRLMPLLPDCELVDTPQWDCPDPDFTFEGCRYTFATLVIRKKPSHP